jgi:ubiquinone/menaquinone biosynthesis C-methylase UbiE
MSSQNRAGGSSAGSVPVSHDDLIRDQFSRQAELFAHSPELHGDEQLKLLVDAARPQPGDASLDIACGPGTVVAAFAPHVRHATGLDATTAMLEQAKVLAAERHITNVEWHVGDVYALPFGDGAFDIVTCRFAFHHFETPAKAFAEMVRVCRVGGRIVLCDGIASADTAKAAAFNAMERHRDPSTAAFQTLSALAALFAVAGLPQPSLTAFPVTYEIEQLIAKSFPVNDDRVTLRRMIDDLVATDALNVGTKPGGTRFIYPAAVLSVTKPLPA